MAAAITYAIFFMLAVMYGNATGLLEFGVAAGFIGGIIPAALVAMTPLRDSALFCGLLAFLFWPVLLVSGNVAFRAGGQPIESSLQESLVLGLIFGVIAGVCIFYIVSLMNLVNRRS